MKDRDNRAHQQMMSDLYMQINDLHDSISKARNIRTQIKRMNIEIDGMNDMEETLQTGKEA